MNYSRQATLEDMAYLAPRLRQADVDEVTAVYDGTIEEALKASYWVSNYCQVMAPEGVPVGVCGVGPTAQEGVGVIWMLATPELEHHALKFLRANREGIQEMLNSGPYRAVHNFTDARNTLHHKWLKWAGAVALRKVPLGRNGEEFIEFVILNTEY